MLYFYCVTQCFSVSLIIFCTFFDRFLYHYSAVNVVYDVPTNKKNTQNEFKG